MKAILLGSPELDVYGQMALDEAIVAQLERDTAILRFFRWPEESFDSKWGRPFYGITFGYFQQYAQVMKQAERSGRPPPAAVRRWTGGGIVYHDGDITFSVGFPWDKLWSPSLVYKDLHRGIHLGLKARAISSRLWSPPDCKTRAVDECFAEPSPIDLVHEDGRKFLGGALRRSRGIGLYQGSMRPEHFGVSRDTLEEAITEGIALEWKLLFRREDATEDVVKAARRLRADRYSTREWNERR